MTKFREFLRRYSLPFSFGLGIFLIGLVVAFNSAQAEKIKAEAKAMDKAATFSESLLYNLQLVIDPAERATELLSSLVTTSENSFDITQEQGFLDLTKGTIPEWRNISVAPGNCIAAVSPREENLGALGYCLNADSHEWAHVSSAIASHNPVFFGPVTLAQGGEAFLYDLPVFLEDGSYWGLVTTVIDSNLLLDSLRESAQSNDMNIKLEWDSLQGGNKTTLVDTLQATNDVKVTESFVDNGAQFTVVASPQQIDYSTVDQILSRTLLSFGIFAAAVFLVAILVQRQRLAYKKLEIITQKSPTALFHLAVRDNKNGTLEYISESATKVLGLSPEQILAENTAFFDRFDSSDRAIAATRIEAAKSPGEIWSQRLRYEHPDGHKMWLQVEASYQKSTDGNGFWYGVFLDTTSAVELEKKLTISAEVFSALNEGVAVLDPEGIILDINPGLTRLTGYSPSDLRGFPFAKLGEGLNKEILYTSLRDSVMTSGFWRGEIVNRHKSGTISKDMLTMTAVRDSEGKISEVVVVMNSFDRMLIDTVTGLPNRVVFEEKLSLKLEEAVSTGTSLALLEIGVHGVGAVNHTFGYKIGDLLLHQIGERIAEYSGTLNKIGRVGDTTFAVAVKNSGDESSLREFSQHLLAGLSAPFFIDDVSVLVAAGIGIAQFPADSTTVEELRSHAGQAYKITADAGESGITFFTPEMETGAKVRTYLTSDLQEALKEKKIQFFYQPIVRVSDRAIVKAEVLARWIDERLGVVSPARFIPLAEESGLIHELGHQLFESALQTALELQKLGRPIQISLNVSPVEFMSPQFTGIDQIRKKKSEGLDTQNIVLELTEGILLNRKDIIESRIALCREKGVSFAIDDFGTGYSSLAYLQQLKVDFVKIDKSFIDKIETDGGFALCRSIVELAHALGLEVIAEGVETEAQFGLLEHLGCEYAQGYLFSPAIDRNAFMEFLGFKQS